jgi:FkbM family methyltransferase
MMDTMYFESAFADTRVGKIGFFANDDPIGRALHQYGEWAQFEIELLSTFIGLGSIVVDVGANIGFHTIAFSQRVGKTGAVLAFEPQRTVFEMLEHNLAANSCENVRAIRAGVGAAASEMIVPRVDYEKHTNIGGIQLLPMASDVAGERVEVVALDDYQLAACHLVKIDAEGMDSDVLLGMAETLRRLRPVVSVECRDIAEGAAILSLGPWTDYQILLFRAAAFNPTNFKRNPENFFGVANESILLFVPTEVAGQLPASRPGAELIPVANLDDLAIALWQTPRFGDETPYDRDPMKLRSIIAATQREHADRFRALDAELKAMREAAARDTARLEFRAANLMQQLRRAEEKAADPRPAEALKAALALVAERDLAIEMLHASTSWKVTAPLRWLKTTFSAKNLSIPRRWRGSGLRKA